MDNENHQPFYLIQHIPKTAGTTLRHIVDQQFGPKNVLTYYNQPSIQLLENIESHLTVFPNYQAIIGHFKFGVHKKLSSPSTYITFLRHPVARTISQYKEWTVNSPERLWGENGEIHTLAESVEKNPDYYRDYQTSFLIGDEMTSVQAASISDIALQNLEDYFDGIGLVEYFDQSVSLIAHDFGWQPHEYAKLNVKIIDVEITPELVEKIISINKHDLIVYETVKKRLLEKFETLETQI